MDEIVKDNASPHNNDTTRQIHRDNNVCVVVGYNITPPEKEDIKSLIWVQVEGYRREQDKRVQITKQTREMD